MSAVVCSAAAGYSVSFRSDIMEKVVKTVIPAKYLDESTKYHINPCGNGKDTAGPFDGTTDLRVRGSWPLAKVVRVHPDHNGVGQQVSILQQGETLRRHVGQLLLLVRAH